MTRQAALWAVAALLGIALAAAVTWATSQLTSQHIGLASEPITAGRALAPADTATDVRTSPQAPRKPSRQQRAATVTHAAPPARVSSTSSQPAPVYTAPAESSAPTVTSAPVTPAAPTTRTKTRPTSRSSERDGASDGSSDDGASPRSGGQSGAHHDD